MCTNFYLEIKLKTSKFKELKIQLSLVSCLYTFIVYLTFGTFPRNSRE